MPEPGTPLSVRELEIVPLIAQGLSNDQIGDRLFLTRDTVKTYVRRIARKLRASNRAHIVHRCYQLGYFLSPGGDDQ
jgi:DNA-binding CsgD family transcriptional regulator